MDCFQEQFASKVPLGVVPVGRTNSLAQSLCPKSDSSVAYVMSNFCFNLKLLIRSHVSMSAYWYLISLVAFTIDNKEQNRLFVLSSCEYSSSVLFPLKLQYSVLCSNVCNYNEVGLSLC